MSRIKYSVDSPHVKAWPELVGNLIVNFSTIEMEACIWLIQLSEQFDSFNRFAEIPFAERVKEVKKYAALRATNNNWGRETARSWDRALELAKLRNRVAHNPIVFGWNDPNEKGTPDYIGIPLMRGKKVPKEIFLSSKTIVTGANSAVQIAHQLSKLRVEWCKQRDEGKTPPVPNNLRGRAWYMARLRYAAHSLKKKIWFR